MSDIKLFEIKPSVAERLSSTVLLEKELQNVIENNMETFFGVRFLKSEYVITEGRMDSIGIDENNCPVIFEYKRSINENVINQGLFYLDWLLDHKADFKLLVIDKLGIAIADQIDWSVPCVICVASDFTKYDIHAVNQMQRNIKLVKYRKYGDDLLLFEHLNAPVVKATSDSVGATAQQTANIGGSPQKSHVEKLVVAKDGIKLLYKEICDFIESLGDDISSNQLKFYVAYKKISNICCIEIFKDHILIHVKLNPDSVKLEKGFSRDTRSIGHYGTGDLELTIRTEDDVAKAKPIIEQAYNEG